MTLETPVTPGRRPGSARPAPQGRALLRRFSEVPTTDQLDRFALSFPAPRVGRRPVCFGGF